MATVVSVVLDLGNVCQAESGVLLLNLTLRLCLSGVALAAGVGKLLDPVGGEQALVDFGLPSRWTKLVARVLPVIEIGLSLAILVDGTAKVASLMVSALFLVFTVGIANLMLQERSPPCNCFGVISSEPVSWRTLARSLCLSIMALVCWGTASFPLTTPVSRFALVLFCFGAYSLYVYSIGKRKQARHAKYDLQMGQRLPPGRLLGGAWLDQVLPKGGLTLILVTAPRCSACRSLKESLSQAIVSIEPTLRFFELTIDAEAPGGKSVEIPLKHQIDAKELARLKLATPSALLVNEWGVLQEQPASGIDEVLALIRMVLADELE